MTPQPEKQVYLRPGELYIGSEPTQVTTVLGSCVSVTLFHAKRRMAAICHGIFADPSPNLSPDQIQGHEGPYRYLSVAIPAMAAAFFRHAIAPQEIEVKLFGGASFCKTCKYRSWGGSVGENNIHRARQLLEEARLQISRSHVGGEVGRKLIFDTGTGVVLLHQLAGTTAGATTAKLPCHDHAH